MFGQTEIRGKNSLGIEIVQERITNINQYRIPKHSAMALFGSCTPSSRQLLFGKNFTTRNACAAISINMTEHDSCNSENSEVNHPSNYKYIIHNGYILYIYTIYIYYLSIYIYTQSL